MPYPDKTRAKSRILFVQNRQEPRSQVFGATIGFFRLQKSTFGLWTCYYFPHTAKNIQEKGIDSIPFLGCGIFPTSRHVKPLSSTS